MLELPELSLRELAVRFTDERKYFVSEASIYRLLKAYDLITSPAYVVIKAANEFKGKTTAINQLWQTDFTYLKITGRGWYDLSTVLDDFSRYIVAWRIGPTMCASDVTATLHQALAASGLDHVHRILLDNYYLPGDLERQIGAVVEHYNHVRYHESINNLTPADVYFGRAETILIERRRIKRETIANRRWQHRLQVA